jgi:hypothetical protein
MAANAVTADPEEESPAKGHHGAQKNQLWPDSSSCAFVSLRGQFSAGFFEMPGL